MDKEFIDILRPKIKSNDRIIMARKEIDSPNFPVKQNNQGGGGVGKPNGLWYAVGTAWIDWVEGEMPEWIKDWQHVYKIEINPSVMCMINNAQKIQELHKKYSYSPYKFSERFNDINWIEVEKNYSGIEIAPYQWKYRHEYSWYYTWDVASGCIWEKDAITKIIKIKI